MLVKRGGKEIKNLVRMLRRQGARDISIYQAGTCELAAMRELIGNRRVWHVIVTTGTDVRPVDDILRFMAQSAVPEVTAWSVSEIQGVCHLWQELG